MGFCECGNEPDSGENKLLSYGTSLFRTWSPTIRWNVLPLSSQSKSLMKA